MLRLLLAVVSISHVLAAPNVICTNGFTLVNNNKCLKLYTKESSYKSAESVCGSFGGSLALSKNAIDNRAIASFVGNAVSRFWMGVYCVENDLTSCLWDDGSTASYSSFANGFPYVDIGNCVYYSTTGSSAGKWYSTDCIDDLNPYVCEIPTTFEDSCKYNYNGNCYLLSQDFNATLRLPFAKAQEFCQQHGANLASIHSPGEIRFLIPILAPWAPMSQINALGGTLSASGYQWIDGSPWDFNYVVTDQAVGCVQFFPYDYWTTYNCEQFTTFVCKRPAGVQNAPSIAPVTVAPFPATCNTSILFAPGGITSPNYPDSYKGNITCTYSLATVGVSQIYLTFPSFTTEWTQDKLMVYDGDSENSPLILSVTNYISTPYPLKSTGNRLFIVFQGIDWVSNLGFHAKFFSFV